MKFKITYLVLVFNEKKTIEKAIKNCLSLPINKEIIVIDNNSDDGTKEILKRLKKIYKKVRIILRKNNLGGAKSVERGIKLSKGKYIYIQYSDLEYDEKTSLKMFKLAEKNKLDVVLGSRVKNRLKKETWFKIIYSRPAFAATFITTKIFNFFYNKKFTDIIGSRLYRRKKIIKVPIKYNDESFDFAFVTQMAKMNLKISEVNTNYKFRKFGSSNMKWYHLINAIIAMFKVKFS